MIDKYLYVDFGTIQYRIPARYIAIHRAEYYARKDNPGKPKDHIDAVTSIKEETEYAMGSDDEIIDWASNNMDWEDVSGVAEVVMKPRFKPDMKWADAEKTVK